MADTVSSLTLFNSPVQLVMKFMSRSDGTGETNVVKVDKSTFTGPNGLEPSYFIIEKIQYDIQGLEVQVSVDATTDVVLARLEGPSGELNYKKVGGISTKASGDTGDILFTTNLHTAGDHYDITLFLRKKD